jgi:hypothetical protein
MDSLLSLPVEIQILVVSGYIAYKISIVGKSIIHRTDDFLMQILVFGFLSRIFTQIIINIPQGYYYLDNYIAIAFISVLTPIVIGSLWRAKIKSAWIFLMEKFGIFRDDLEFSAWDSMIHSNASWNYIQIFCNDGNIYESEFELVPIDVPMGRITLSNDAVCIYITGVHRKNHTFQKINPRDGDRGYIVDYIPRSSIERISVCWTT